MEKKLSILICTLTKRAALVNRLMGVLQPQITEEVEVLTERDAGQLKIGRKRNKLLRKASGTFVCFIDDDDLVSSDYVEKILNAIKNNPDCDCCGIEGEITTDNKNPAKFIHSIKYNSWYEEGGIYYRTPNHLNPVKREIALKAMFPELNHGEDKSYSDRIFPLLKKEAYIDGIIYHYLFMSQKKVILTKNTLKEKIQIQRDNMIAQNKAKMEQKNAEQKLIEQRNIEANKLRTQDSAQMNFPPKKNKYILGGKNLRPR